MAYKMLYVLRKNCIIGRRGEVFEVINENTILRNTKTGFAINMAMIRDFEKHFIQMTESKTFSIVNGVKVIANSEKFIIDGQEFLWKDMSYFVDQIRMNKKFAVSSIRVGKFEITIPQLIEINEYVTLTDHAV